MPDHWGVDGGPRENLAEDASLLEPISMALTLPRICISLGTLVVCILGMCLTDARSFAMPRVVVNVVNLDDCKVMCSAQKGSLCDTLTFEEKLCPATQGMGPCVNALQEVQELVTDTIDYVKVPQCQFMVQRPKWHPFLVLAILAMSITLIVDGKATEVMLMGACCLFAFFGIISPGDAFGGLASNSVLGLAFLFPIASAIEETGVLDRTISVVLGRPRSYFMALIRMMLPVAVLSAFLSNTAVMAMMIPVVISWGRRLNISPGKMLMPLSFAAQLGGSCTLIGSSHVLVAKDSVDTQVYSMGFFDMVPTGCLVGAGTFFAICVCTPFLQATGGSGSAEEMAAVAEESGNRRDRSYVAVLVVPAFSSYIHGDSDEVCSQLSRLPGVHSAEAGVEAESLKVGSEIRCYCTPAGVISLRQIRDLFLHNAEDLRKLGTHRRQRYVYEAVVAAGSTLVGPLDVHFMRHYGGAILTVRGKPPLSRVDSTIEEGDVLMIETEHWRTKSKAWSEAFSLVSMVPNSQPPRYSGGVRERQRAIFVCGGMFVLITLVTFSVIALSYGAGVFVLLLLLVRARSVTQVFESMKVPVLLTIAGAFGVSEALEQTGIATFAAKGVTDFALQAGATGVRLAIYIMAMVLSMFINNSATVAIMGPMVTSMAVAAHTSLSSLVWILVMAAGSCFTTPLGYQTNLMVMKDGGYSFGDFMRYGSVLQIMHCALTLLVISLVCDIMRFEL